MKKLLKNKIPVFIFLAMAVCGCEKIIEPKDLPQQDPRIVLNAVLEKDDSIRANISISKSILSGKEYKLIDDASCDLYVNGQFSERLKNLKLGRYITAQQVKTGTTYAFKVSVSGYKDVEGSTTVPDYATLGKSERYDTTNSRFFLSNSPNIFGIYGQVKFKIYIKDDLSKYNYYGISPVIELYDSLGRRINTIVSAYINSNANTGFTNTSFSNGNSVESDDKYLVNGNEVVFDVAINISSNTEAANYARNADIKFILSSYSEDLYKYKVTLGQQAATSGGLFSEPVLVFNNITNGLGIVGSINSQTISAGRVSMRRN